MNLIRHPSKHRSLRYLVKLSILPVLMLSDMAIADIVEESVKVSPTFLGLYVNGSEQDSIDVLEIKQQHEDSSKSSTTYFVELDSISELANIGYTKLDTGYEFNTPIGTAIIPQSEIYSHDTGIFKDKEFVALSTLKTIGITAFFEQTSFAIHLNMGWKQDWNQNSQDSLQSSNHNKTQGLPIDYYPSRFGLLGLKVNTGYTNRTLDDKRSDNLNTTIGALGYGFGGAWGVHANTQDSLNDDDKFNAEDITIDTLFWTGSNDNWATRLGTSQSSIANNTFGEITGISLAYSSRDINRHLSSFSSTSNSLLKGSTQDYQNITGAGVLGGVAELRINARPIARVQIGLDGRYEFNNLDVSRLSLDDAIIEVAIFDYPLALEPIEIRTISLGIRRANVATDELLLEAGYGMDGNIINQWQDDTKDKKETYNGYAYGEYGLANNVAIRGGLSHQYSKQPIENSYAQDDNKHHQFASMVGINVATSPYSNLDIEYQHNDTEGDWRLNWEYEKDKFSANYFYTQNNTNKKKVADDNLEPASTRSLREHSLSMYYRPSENTHYRLSQYYRYGDYYDELGYNSYDDRNNNRYYAIASVNSRLSENLQANATWQTRDDLYNYNIQWRQPHHQNTISLSGNNDKDSLTLQHQLSADTRIRTQVNKWHGYRPLHWLGDVSHDFTNDNKLNAGVSLFNGNFGWQTNWQFYQKQGVRLSLGYENNYLPSYPTDYLLSQDDMNNPLSDKSRIGRYQLTPNDYLYVQLQLDFWKPPNRLPQLGVYPARKQGSILVDVAHPSDLQLENDNILFKLDEQTVRSEIVQSSDTSSQLLIPNLKSGSYRIEMDGQNLPFEYDITNLPTPRVQVSNYASTYLPMTLKKTYAISGKLTDKQSSHPLELWQNGQMIQAINSGIFGYFQILGLQSGDYTLKSQGYESQEISVNQNNVLGVRLIPHNQ